MGRLGERRFVDRLGRRRRLGREEGREGRKDGHRSRKEGREVGWRRSKGKAVDPQLKGGQWEEEEESVSFLASREFSMLYLSCRFCRGCWCEGGGLCARSGPSLVCPARFQTPTHTLLARHYSETGVQSVHSTDRLEREGGIQKLCVLATNMCESGSESMIQRTSQVLVQKEKRKERITLQKKEETDVCSDG